MRDILGIPPLQLRREEKALRPFSKPKSWRISRVYIVKRHFLSVSDIWSTIKYLVTLELSGWVRSSDRGERLSLLYSTQFQPILYTIFQIWDCVEWNMKQICIVEKGVGWWFCWVNYKITELSLHRTCVVIYLMDTT